MNNKEEIKNWLIGLKEKQDINIIVSATEYRRTIDDSSLVYASVVSVFNNKRDLMDSKTIYACEYKDRGEYNSLLINIFPFNTNYNILYTPLTAQISGYIPVEKFDFCLNKERPL